VLAGRAPLRGLYGFLRFARANFNYSLQVNFEYFLAIAIQAASTTRSAAALTARSGTAAGPIGCPQR
jgi:hypothetical protein